MAINHNLGFKETVKVLGLKRRFFGFESDKSLALRVVTEISKLNTFPDFMAKIFNPPPRVCIREEVEDYAAPINRYCVKQWTFHYNDGTTEIVTLRGL